LLEVKPFSTEINNNLGRMTSKNSVAGVNGDNINIAIKNAANIILTNP